METSNPLTLEPLTLGFRGTGWGEWETVRGQEWLQISGLGLQGKEIEESQQVWRKKKSLNLIWNVVWTWDACGVFSMRCLMGSHLPHPEAQERGLAWGWRFGRHLCLGGSELTPESRKSNKERLRTEVWEWWVLRGEQERRVGKGHGEGRARGTWRNSGQANTMEVTAARRTDSRSGCGQH